MTNLDRFTLEGQTYYQQGRKCGREGCKCQAGDLHGPYWYTRNIDNGRVQYIGKELPSAIVGTRAAHDLLLPNMLRERRRLADLFDAVSRLIRNDPLSDADRRAVESLGLGAALVFQRDAQDTQDDGGALVSLTRLDRTQDDARALVLPGGSAGAQDAGLCMAILGGTQEGAQ
jgi:hypothetical protein